MARAMVMFSGGQDSTVCLAKALEQYDEVETIGFNYGQRHIVEMECRVRVIGALRDRFPSWSARLGPDHVLDLTLLAQISDSALTSEAELGLLKNGLPNTFVPGRNLLFLTYAAALAYRRNISILVGGMCETDYSGYPDCRDTTMQAMQLALTLGMEEPFEIVTPLMWLDKAATWKLAHDLGGESLVKIIQEHTHTCYQGNRTSKQIWGYGCRVCPACKLRAAGYEKFLAMS